MKCCHMTFGEDASRNRKEYTGENLAVVRKIALNILKNYKTEKPMTTRSKMKKCDDDFLADVLTNLAA